jgi:FdhD protein
MSHNKIQKTKISKVSHNESQPMTDYLAVEAPLEIRLTSNLTSSDTKEFATFVITMCSPENIEDFIYGYLFTESIISQTDDIIEINIFDNDLGLIAEVELDQAINYKKHLNKRQGMAHASCGICGKTDFDDMLTFNYTKLKSSPSKIPESIIQSLPEKLNQQQHAFKSTGGLHACAVFDKIGQLLHVREDIGRHNALDKLIGVALQKQLLPLSDCIILLSGRISFELVHKSLIAGVSTLAAIGAPSSLSVEIAKLNEMQLIGFVKPEGYKQY